jgi:hypothetical protein
LYPSRASVIVTLDFARNPGLERGSVNRSNVRISRRAVFPIALYKPDCCESQTRSVLLLSFPKLASPFYLDPALLHDNLISTMLLEISSHRFLPMLVLF